MFLADSLPNRALTDFTTSPSWNGKLDLLLALLMILGRALTCRLLIQETLLLLCRLQVLICKGGRRPPVLPPDLEEAVPVMMLCWCTYVFYMLYVT